MLYAVIMAGGIGSRFWPKSRMSHPKQFLKVFGEATLLQNTVARLQGLIPLEQCYIVTHRRYVDKTQEQLPALPLENILAEPLGRNTAPCITYAALKLLSRDPEALMVVLPADHVIRNVRAFHQTLQVAIEKARQPGALVTIGLNPTYPATGYGYIQFEGSTEHLFDEPRPYRVRTFAEKPDLATAERFLDSGDFLWNSGMFIWRADTILNAIQRYLPDLYEAFEPLRQGLGTPKEPHLLEEAYQVCPSISIDYGVMERAENVWVVPGNFEWNDVGDWRAVYDLSEKDALGNALQGHVIVHNASRNYVDAERRLVVLVGIHDTAVIDTEDALLICHLESTQQVKNIVEYLQTHRLDAYL